MRALSILLFLFTITIGACVQEPEPEEPEPLVCLGEHIEAMAEAYCVRAYECMEDPPVGKALEKQIEDCIEYNAINVEIAYLSKGRRYGDKVSPEGSDKFDQCVLDLSMLSCKPGTKFSTTCNEVLRDPPK